jgi:hypothetical protein
VSADRERQLDMALVAVDQANAPLANNSAAAAAQPDVQSHRHHLRIIVPPAVASRPLPGTSNANNDGGVRIVSTVNRG